MALFSKNKKEKTKEVKNLKQADIVNEETSENVSGGSSAFSSSGGFETHRILRGFYVSEKASLGSSANQYTFRVFEGANKSEVKKEVYRLFNVEIKSVKMLNMPEKRRDFGNHPGIKSGFKKGIVVLEEGYVIGQAKP